MVWENGPWPGGFTTPDTGEYPSAVVESRLSAILEDCVPPKYYLSERARAGILRRAQARNKPLPEPLLEALRNPEMPTD